VGRRWDTAVPTCGTTAWAAGGTPQGLDPLAHLDRRFLRGSEESSRPMMTAAKMHRGGGVTASSSSNRALIALILYWPAATFLFMHFEVGWSLQDTLYFMVLTLTTVGYGDVSPTTQEGRLLAIGYMLFNVCCLSFLIHRAVSHFMARRELHELSAHKGTGESGGADDAELAAMEASLEVESMLETETIMETEGIISGASKLAHLKSDEGTARTAAEAKADNRERIHWASVRRSVLVTLFVFLLGTAGFRYMGYGGCEEPTCDLDPATDSTDVCPKGCSFTCKCTQDAAAAAASPATGEPPVEQLFRDASSGEVELVELVLHGNRSGCPAGCMATSSCKGTATPLHRRKGMCETSSFLSGTCGTEGQDDCPENAEWIDAMYFATYTMTTVGYGDIASPKHWHGRLFTMFFSLLSTLSLTTAVANAVNYLHAKTQRAQMLTMFTDQNYLKNLMKRMDRDGTTTTMMISSHHVSSRVG
jgi:hypothetical protein